MWYNVMLVNQIQEIYRLQGIDIGNDKHIELICPTNAS